MSGGESIFRVRLLPDGRLEYEDWRGNTSTCAQGEIGSRITRVLQDPGLPPVERMGAGGHNMAEAYARMVLPPQYQALARPAANLLVQALQRLMASGHGAAYARQQQPPPQGPQAQREPDPRQAHRRGHRVA